MNLIIPMAGRGSRFANCGITTPKPLIPINAKPMIAWSLESLKGFSFSQVIFIILSMHEINFKISEELQKYVESPFKIILLDNITEGQLCTTLAAREYINSNEDVLIASSDTFVVSDLAKDINSRSTDTMGIISVANVPGESWSFARTDENGRVVEVSEKVRISNFASTGLYYFSNGYKFVQVADKIISSGEKMQGEYYVISVYKKYIEYGWRVDISLADEMWDMGTPESLKKFKDYLNNRKSKRFEKEII
jgi:NDP-sugar pyrophosphorylase family protein